MLNQFYSWNGTQLTAADPLIVAGEDLVPLLIERIKRIKDPGMPKRNVAILYLCGYGYTDAIPVIRSIVENEEEHEVDRSVALYSLARCELKLARDLAEIYSDRSDGLGKTARELLQNGVIERPKRSYRAAYLSFITKGGVQIGDRMNRLLAKYAAFGEVN